jgi:predicted nucleic acid-binding Zn ribbon protein
MIRFPGPPPWATTSDPVATRAQRAREAREEREAKACLWCGGSLPTKPATCSNACRSALARYERAKREGREVPFYKGVQAHPAGHR